MHGVPPPFPPPNNNYFFTVISTSNPFARSLAHYCSGRIGKKFSHTGPFFLRHCVLHADSRGIIAYDLSCMRYIEESPLFSRCVKPLQPASLSPPSIYNAITLNIPSVYACDRRKRSAPFVQLCVWTDVHLKLREKNALHLSLAIKPFRTRHMQIGIGDWGMRKAAFKSHFIYVTLMNVTYTVIQRLCLFYSHI
jgi:hypothetical protein